MTAAAQFFNDFDTSAYKAMHSCYKETTRKLKVVGQAEIPSNSVDSTNIPILLPAVNHNRAISVNPQVSSASSKTTVGRLRLATWWYFYDAARLAHEGFAAASLADTRIAAPTNDLAAFVSTSMMNVVPDITVCVCQTRTVGNHCLETVKHVRGDLPRGDPPLVCERGSKRLAQKQLPCAGSEYCERPHAHYPTLVTYHTLSPVSVYIGQIGQTLPYWLKAVHDKVSTFEISLRRMSLPLPAYISTDALSDMHPVKLVTMDGAIPAKAVIIDCDGSSPETSSMLHCAEKHDYQIVLAHPLKSSTSQVLRGGGGMTLARSAGKHFPSRRVTAMIAQTRTSRKAAPLTFLNFEVFRNDRAASECKGGGNGRSPRKPADEPHRPARFPLWATPPGIEPGSPWWEASGLITTPAGPNVLDSGEVLLMAFLVALMTAEAALMDLYVLRVTQSVQVNPVDGEPRDYYTNFLQYWRYVPAVVLPTLWPKMMHLLWCWTTSSMEAGCDTVEHGNIQTSDILLREILQQLAQRTIQILCRCLWPMLPSTLVPNLLEGREVWGPCWTMKHVGITKARQRYQCRLRPGIIQLENGVVKFHQDVVRVISWKSRCVVKAPSSITRNRTVMLPIPGRMLHVLAKLRYVIVDDVREAVTTDLALLAAWMRYWGTQAYPPAAGNYIIILLASHHDELGSIHGPVTSGNPHVGIVPDDATSRRVLYGNSRFSSGVYHIWPIFALIYIGCRRGCKPQACRSLPLRISNPDAWPITTTPRGVVGAYRFLINTCNNGRNTVFHRCSAYSTYGGVRVQRFVVDAWSQFLHGLTLQPAFMVLAVTVFAAQLAYLVPLIVDNVTIFYNWYCTTFILLLGEEPGQAGAEARGIGASEPITQPWMTSMELATQPFLLDGCHLVSRMIVAILLVSTSLPALAFHLEYF
ncbi:hypothetical protein PR048_001729 [Dryococelus australis]|uniref:Uncharacterized protein n=1 Tax=Dryococelus australis TaxID=614101 RepID=A0ABQ9II63_9NEOP|nr:hypothetical protein PR048_001729 [Dryococelus australis]